MMKAKCKNGGMGEVGDTKGIMEDDGNGGEGDMGGIFGAGGEFLGNLLYFWLIINHKIREMDAGKMKEEIRKACEVLREGGLILYPTDTIWGIGCDATNEEAVRRVFALKRREDSKAMLVLLDDVGRVPSYVEMPDVAYDLLEVADRPMTIIYPGAKHLAPSLVAADGSVGIRVTREAFSRGLVERFRRPVVSTSANVSGEPPPRCFAEISEEVKRGVDYVVDFRQEETANPAPSSIIKLGVGGEIQIIRK